MCSLVTGVQSCALPISLPGSAAAAADPSGTVDEPSPLSAAVPPAPVVLVDDSTGSVVVVGAPVVVVAASSDVGSADVTVSSSSSPPNVTASKAEEIGRAACRGRGG